MNRDQLEAGIWQTLAVGGDAQVMVRRILRLADAYARAEATAAAERRRVLADTPPPPRSVIWGRP